MMKHKYIAAISISIFILLNLAQAIYPIIQIKPLDEKRELSTLPGGNFLKNLWEDPTFSQKIENYASDHFPLRDAIVRIQNQLEFTIFHQAKEVVIGSDGWLSDKEVINVQLPQLNNVSDNDIQYSIKQIKKLQEYLRRNDTSLLIVVVPMKATIYVDKFKKVNRDSLILSGLDRFQLALNKNQIPYLDLKSKFSEIRDTSQLYYKTDVHWSTVGAAVAAKGIVDYFSSLNKVSSPWRDNLRKNEQEFVGSDSKSIPMLKEIKEVVPVLSVDESFSRSFTDDTYPSPVLTHIGTNNRLAKLPQMIMFGNSFMLNYQSVGFQDYFQSSTRVLDYQYFSRVLDYIRPSDRIFIWNIYETQLLFHILPPDNFGYWDRRILNMSLPKEFVYKK